jgi:hypothetical protein
VGGPRATELFSAVTAAAVAGVAALARSTEVVAEFAAALAARLEAAHQQVCALSREYVNLAVAFFSCNRANPHQPEWIGGTAAAAVHGSVTS